MQHVATLGVPPPTDPRARIQSGRFLRALLLRCLGLSVVLCVLTRTPRGDRLNLSIEDALFWYARRAARPHDRGRDARRVADRVPRRHVRRDVRGRADEDSRGPGASALRAAVDQL